MYSYSDFACSCGCRNCPRMRRCVAGRPEPAAGQPVFAAARPAAEHRGECAGRYEEPSALRVQAFRGRQAIPVEGVHVTVTCPVGGPEEIFFEGETDESGIIDPIRLPAPDVSRSLSPDQQDPCSRYIVTAGHPDFETLRTEVQIFPGVKTVQPLQMQLKQV